MNKANYTDILDLQDEIEDLRDEIRSVESSISATDSDITSLKLEDIDIIRRLTDLENTVSVLSEHAQMVGATIGGILDVLKIELNIDINEE
ncbi:hypothetical protein ETI01_10660 [Macrococcoides caseolyticum]|uniref:hypothetical protein n=1 Tax=Macrococcoides caseolyticum TaxID=69966 RepID=UPI00105C07FA|nr:hypothetical protein [Macrococcus caseolyticus]TDM20991.1 hypothetical protein ETI01_10660 [Macrococcus caseolyticus]